MTDAKLELTSYSVSSRDLSMVGGLNVKTPEPEPSSAATEVVSSDSRFASTAGKLVPLSPPRHVALKALRAVNATWRSSLYIDKKRQQKQ